MGSVLTLDDFWAFSSESLSSLKTIDRDRTILIKEQSDYISRVTFDRTTLVVELKLRALSRISRSSKYVGFSPIFKISLLLQSLNDLASKSTKALQFAKCYKIMDIDNYGLKARSAQANEAILGAERFNTMESSE